MFGDPQSLCSSIAERSHLREGSRGVERIILEMYRRQNKKISNKELSRIVRIPVPVVSAVRSEMLKTGLLKTKSLFTTEAIEWIEHKLGFTYTMEFLQDFISDSSLKVSEKYIDFFAPVIEALNRRPAPEYVYDQSRSTPETVLKRVLLMLENGDVEGKRIVILGDDDGVSIALAFLQCAKEILVIDIDSRVLEFITSFAEEYNLTEVLHCQLWDIRTTFPKKWWHRFDTFETDPPYTVTGFKVFIDQALTLLELKEGGRGYISFGTKSPHETWAVQQHLLEGGLSIESYYPNFNQYHGATILGNTSNLYVVSSVPQKTRLLEVKQPPSEIYTFDEKKITALPTVGYQIIAEFYGVKPDFLNDAELITQILQNGIKKSQLRQEEMFVKKYSPYGISVIIILVESHCHLHTWPEWDYLSLDIFVCEAKEKAEKFFQYLLRTIDPLDYHKFQFFRGKPPSSL
ncbi:MAG: adenosylmethionine decarboxylase [Candidatus Heimdallarchaeota archaeon]|nr:MAG: adenosylmethionine decarboxylase [Candidatus Heimdallarchaeota archaeon]